MPVPVDVEITKRTWYPVEKTAMLSHAIKSDPSTRVGAWINRLDVKVNCDRPRD